MTTMISDLHGQIVFQRRVRALCAALAPLLKPGKVLDVGAGSGMLAALIMQQRADVQITGIDVHLRPESFVPVTQYDGSHIPHEDNSFDSVMIVDVLHHTDDPARVLAECLRVSRGVVVIKDHFQENALEHAVLRGMDWVGNKGHGVRLPYNYFSRASWASALRQIGAREHLRQEAVTGLYPQPFQALIGRRIQFVAQVGR
jgi:ubiquinone/menaquinone biosynthesis C-methylase UbiE